MQSLDFRSKFIVFLYTVFLTSFLSDDVIFYILLFMLLCYLLILRYQKEAITISCVIIFVAFVQFISNGYDLVFLPQMFLFIIIRTIAVISSAIPIVKMSSSEVMAVMKKLRISQNISLPLVFMIRFFPTVMHELKNIFNALKLRGLLSCKHPLFTLEYMFIPMMFLASKTAEELAAAAETRGIGASNKHTSRKKIEFRAVDWIFVIFVTCIVAFIIYVQKRLLV